MFNTCQFKIFGYVDNHLGGNAVSRFCHNLYKSLKQGLCIVHAVVSMRMHEIIFTMLSFKPKLASNASPCMHYMISDLLLFCLICL